MSPWRRSTRRIVAMILSLPPYERAVAMQHIRRMAARHRELHLRLVVDNTKAEETAA